MSNYTFQNLSPFDFEMLCKDIAQKKYNKKFEAFTIGRDGGTDLRYYYGNAKIVIQCKHYEKSGYSQLKSKLKTEISSVRQLNPTKYCVMTSIGLTPANKDELKDLLEPFITNTSDIIDATELNALLSTNEVIVRDHPKLWMLSAAVLDKILHNAIYIGSQIEREAIAEKIKICVRNDFFSKAFDILSEKSVCIISGVPGIGKTTMAEMLAYQLCAEGYEFYSVNKITDILTVLTVPQKRVFYYDDFLGSTQFEDKNECKDFHKVLQYISKRADTKLLLTTREYIYQQGLKKSEELDRLDLQSTILKLSDYSDFDKAKILYNHLYYSDLPSTYCNYLIQDKRYERIIKHPNYSPRLIEWMTFKMKKDTLATEAEYYKSFMDSLNNPAKIWDKAFEQYISECSRIILYELYLSGKIVEVDKIKRLTLEWLRKNTKNISSDEFDILFSSSLKELENTFISIKISSGITYMTFDNPSIDDYIGERLNGEKSLIREYTDLPFIFWDQKINILKHLSETEQKSIINEMIDNYGLDTLTCTQSNQLIRPYYSEAKMISFLFDYVQDKDYKAEFMDSIAAILSRQLQKMSSYDYEYDPMLSNLPPKYCTRDLKSSLKVFFNNADFADELSNLLYLNEDIRFITNEYEIENKIQKIFEFEKDNYLNGDYNYLISLEEDIDTICGIQNMERPDFCNAIEDRIQELEVKKDEQADYDRDDYRDFPPFDYKIEDLFASFSKD
ncbi:MAG: restriction endonuclease [Treponema sp.]|nr:restriction endonuclease [Treponema sp.]